MARANRPSSARRKRIASADAVTFPQESTGTMQGPAQRASRRRDTAGRALAIVSGEGRADLPAMDATRYWRGEQTGQTFDPHGHYHVSITAGDTASVPWQVRRD